MVGHSPVEIRALEIVHALLLHAVRDADVDTVRGKHSVDLSEHLGGVGATTITTEDRVEGTLVNDGVEATISVLKLAAIHLLVDEGGETLLVSLGHLLHNSVRDVDVAHVLVAILVHLFGETYRQTQEGLDTLLRSSKTFISNSEAFKNFEWLRSKFKLEWDHIVA